MLSKTQVKYIQSLGHKKCRDEEDLFLAEGPKIVKELLSSKNITIRQIYAVNSWIRNNPAVSVGVSEITEQELERISQLKTPNQVIAIVEKIKWKDEPDYKEKVSLVLDSIQDPGNFGTIIRLADWFGIKQIICSPNCADVYNPKVVQSSMGSITRVQIEYTDLLHFLMKNKEIKIYAAKLEGISITKIGKLKEGFIVIGNESKGISPEISNLPSVSITIPSNGEAESLNAAVATGIILSHISHSTL